MSEDTKRKAERDAHRKPRTENHPVAYADLTGTPVTAGGELDDKYPEPHAETEPAETDVVAYGEGSPNTIGGVGAGSLLWWEDPDEGWSRGDPEEGAESENQ